MVPALQGRSSSDSSGGWAWATPAPESATANVHANVKRRPNCMVRLYRGHAVPPSLSWNLPADRADTREEPWRKSGVVSRVLSPVRSPSPGGGHSSKRRYLERDGPP